MTDRDFLIELAMSFNEYVPPSEPNGQHQTGQGRPGDEFNARATWEEVLGPHGWQKVFERGGVGYWRRPGKDGRAWSATTGRCKSQKGEDLLYVFSTSCPPFESEHSYSRFAAYALLDHQGDYRAATQALVAKGFGPPARAKHSANGTANGDGAAHGDAYEGPDPQKSQEREKRAFPAPIPASLLKLGQYGDWIWKGYLSRGNVTLMSALWKAGKTTLLAHLLKSLAAGGQFCGLDLAPAKVLFVTEESEGRWAKRRDELQLEDNVSFLIRPFRAKPNYGDWGDFLKYVGELQAKSPSDLLVFDPLVNLWPVKDENDASQVQAALMPIHQCLGRAAGLLVHHNRKGDGTEATASRGSGALTGWVDTIIELRRYLPTNRKDRRRVLTGYSREAEIPEELVIELTAAGYITHGDRADAWKGDLKTALLRMLPCDGNGWTFEQIKENWREDEVPTKQRVVDALDLLGEEGHVLKTGEGVKGDPFRYRATPPA